jgi:hypothetical protein
LSSLAGALLNQQGPIHPPADSSPTGVEENLPETRRCQDMPNGNPFAGKKLRLADNCLFFQIALGPPRGFLLRLGPNPKRWHSERKSALMLLDLLVREGDKGILYEDIKKHVLRQFDVTEPKAEEALIDFLKKLKIRQVLTEVGQEEQQDFSDPFYPDLGNEKETAELPDIQGGASLFCCGYVVSRYRP